jgi:uncharacterized protein (TIGR02246 family)
MVNQPEALYPALCAAFNAADLEALLACYDPKAVYVIKPGRVTEGPAGLRAAMQHNLSTRGRLGVRPETVVRSEDVALVHGTFTLSGQRSDGSAFERTSRFADVLRRQPDGGWRIAIDNPFGGA